MHPRGMLLRGWLLAPAVLVLLTATHKVQADDAHTGFGQLPDKEITPKYTTAGLKCSFPTVYNDVVVDDCVLREGLQRQCQVLNGTWMACDDTGTVQPVAEGPSPPIPLADTSVQPVNRTTTFGQPCDLPMAFDFGFIAYDCVTIQGKPRCRVKGQTAWAQCDMSQPLGSSQSGIGDDAGSPGDAPSALGPIPGFLDVTLDGAAAPTQALALQAYDNQTLAKDAPGNVIRPKYTTSGDKCVFPTISQGVVVDDCILSNKFVRQCQIRNGTWLPCDDTGSVQPKASPPMPPLSPVPDDRQPLNRTTIYGQQCDLPMVFDFGFVAYDCITLEGAPRCRVSGQNAWAECDASAFRTPPGAQPASGLSPNLQIPGLTPSQAPLAQPLPELYDQLLKSPPVSPKAGAAPQTPAPPVTEASPPPIRLTTDGLQCVFPTVYNGLTDDCVMDPYLGVHRCQIADGHWKYCEETPYPNQPTSLHIPADLNKPVPVRYTTGGALCQFPAQYRGSLTWDCVQFEGSEVCRVAGVNTWQICQPRGYGPAAAAPSALPIAGSGKGASKKGKVLAAALGAILGALGVLIPCLCCIAFLRWRRRRQIRDSQARWEGVRKAVKANLTTQQEERLRLPEEDVIGEERARAVQDVSLEMSRLDSAQVKPALLATYPRAGKATKALDVFWVHPDDILRTSATDDFHDDLGDSEAGGSSSSSARSSLTRAAARVPAALEPVPADHAPGAPPTGPTPGSTVAGKAQIGAGVAADDSQSHDGQGDDPHGAATARPAPNVALALPVLDANSAADDDLAHTAGVPEKTLITPRDITGVPEEALITPRDDGSFASRIPKPPPTPDHPSFESRIPKPSPAKSSASASPNNRVSVTPVTTPAPPEGMGARVARLLKRTNSSLNERDSLLADAWGSGDMAAIIGATEAAGASEETAARVARLLKRSNSSMNDRDTLLAEAWGSGDIATVIGSIEAAPSLAEVPRAAGEAHEAQRAERDAGTHAGDLPSTSKARRGSISNDEPVPPAPEAPNLSRASM
ncbi:hypothetical protein WJX72_010002 [[Myrmecia] bisecta]|uniref:Sushi domain-containing protein n=1 Tax=[Myrmecia] bisecta TaxID=41462 RepID=A0AAW1PIC5_9CHLO